MRTGSMKDLLPIGIIVVYSIALQAPSINAQGVLFVRTKLLLPLFFAMQVLRDLAVQAVLTSLCNIMTACASQAATCSNGKPVRWHQ